MKLKEIYKPDKTVITYEIFPPKGDFSEIESKTKALLEELRLLAEFNPAFISVTYGAGGSTRDKTLDLVFRIKKEFNIMPLPHFTCTGTEKSGIFQYIKTIQDAKISNILALRGDPPQGEAKFIKSENGFGYANELVEFIKDNTDLGIAVAGYPEGHQECLSIDQDIINLKRKVDAGADIIITQLFYDNKFFFNFLEKIRNAGINIPVIPGILPITNVSQIEKMTVMCGCTVPDGLMKKLRTYKDDNNAVREIGIEYAVKQCRELIENNAPWLHFCTLNKAFSTKRILEELSLPI